MPAMFLASIPKQIAAYQLSSTSASLEAVIEDFFLNGLSIDIIGSCPAYLTAISLQKLHTQTLIRSEMVKAVAPCRM